MSVTPWFEEAFGRHYLTVYAHRDDASAAREAEFAARALGLTGGRRVLDIACGAGRHARALAARKLEVTAVDLSGDLVAEAGRRGGAGVAYLRADMRRLPFRTAFDGATMFFTSFGYFDEEEEDRRVLGEAARVLVPGGRLLLDYVNRDRVIEDLVPESTSRVRGFDVSQTRWMTPDGRRVEKRVRMTEGGVLVKDYTESVRLYPPEEVSSMLRTSGIALEERYGDLAGSPFTSDSTRLVLVGRRACS